MHSTDYITLFYNLTLINFIFIIILLSSSYILLLLHPPPPPKHLPHYPPRLLLPLPYPPHPLAFQTLLHLLV